MGCHLASSPCTGFGIIFCTQLIHFRGLFPLVRHWAHCSSHSLHLLAYQDFGAAGLCRRLSVRVVALTCSSLLCHVVRSILMFA